MGFQKIDKKQMPQVIGLGAASVGMFGYFAFKMLVPTVSAAPPPSAAKNVQTAAASGAPSAPGAATPAGVAGATPADAVAVADAPPPLPGMRDPFIPTITDPGLAALAPATAPAAHPTQMVSTQGVRPGALSFPSAPPLPPAGGGYGAPPLPSTGGTGPVAPASGGLAPMPAAPSWTVTGVLQSGNEQVAILRSGEARQFAHRGDIIGGDFRVVDVTRDAVVLRHGGARYTLPLGGARVPDAAPRKAAQPSRAFAADAVTPTPGEQTPGQADQGRPAFQGVAGTLGGAPQGTADAVLSHASDALAHVSDALNGTQDTAQKH